MIPARHHWFFVPFLRFYTRLMLSICFKRTRIFGTIEDKNLPILIIANHISWWDGFWMLHLNDQRFKRKFHVVMLEEQLKSRMFLNKAGAFSIRKGTRDIITSLNYASSLMTDRQNLLLFFPQGEIQSLYQRPLHFEKGLLKLLTQLQQPVQIIFAANLINYFSDPRPELAIFLKEFTFDSASDAEEAYNRFYADALSNYKPTS